MTSIFRMNGVDPSVKRAGRANTLRFVAPVAAAALLLLPGGGALAHGPMPLTPDRAWTSWTSWSRDKAWPW